MALTMGGPDDDERIDVMRIVAAVGEEVPDPPQSLIVILIF